MKKKAIQTLIFLNSRQETKLDSTNIYQAINQLPTTNLNDIKHNAKQYATSELFNEYGIQYQEEVSGDTKKLTQQIVNKINELRKAKSIRLAGFIQRLGQKINFQQLQQARYFLQALDNKEVKQLYFTLEVLQKVVKQKLERQEELGQNHTVASAISLIQELKKVKKVNQL